MLCPSCRTELVVDGQARLETLDEHVFNPNGIPSLKDRYVCPNPDCLVAANTCWNSDGELYSKDYREAKRLEESGAYIDNNDAPFGSFQRKCNVEIYKKDENRDLFRLGRFRFKKVYLYQSNEDGDILKRRWKIEIWKREKDGFGETLYIPGIKMLMFSIRHFHRERKFRNTPGLLDESQSWRRRGEWWRKVAYRYAVIVNRLFPVKIEG